MEEMSGRSVKMAGRIVISSVMRRGNSREVQRQIARERKPKKTGRIVWEIDFRSCYV